MLAEKVVVIIGGTSGIGAAIAEACVKADAVVVPVSRSETKVVKTLARLKKQGNTWNKSLTVDVRDERNVRNFVQEVIKQTKHIDVLVCTAGAYLKKESLAMTTAEWQSIVDTNITGVYFANKYIGARMIKQGHGSIINISSLGARVALSHATAYCVSKAAVSMLTKSLACEWAEKGVRVNAILPGVFPTELNKKALQDTKRKRNIVRKTPLRRLGDLSEITSAALYLASDEASFVTGTEIVVDGGFLASSGF